MIKHRAARARDARAELSHAWTELVYLYVARARVGKASHGVEKQTVVKLKMVVKKLNQRGPTHPERRTTRSDRRLVTKMYIDDEDGRIEMDQGGGLCC
jgi:hypothetical protein